MSAYRLPRSGMPSYDGDRCYPARLPAGPWVVPLAWLLVPLLAGLFA